MPGIEVETHGAVRVLRLAEPGNRNALGETIRAGLAKEVPAYFSDPSLRCLMITGSGGAFCAGGDLESLRKVSGAAEMRDRMEQAHRWIVPLLGGEKPVVCAVNGPAVGAGLGLALLGDLVIASQDAFFMAGFSMIGAVADFGLGITLPRSVGMARAKDILLTNRRVDADEALAIGLVSRCLPSEGFFETTLAISQKLAKGPGFSTGQTKTLLNLGPTGDIRGYLSAEAVAQAEALNTPDAREGIAAFLEKRAPRFNQG